MSSLISDKARFFNQLERELYGNFITNAKQLDYELEISIAW